MSSVTWIPRIGDEFAGYRLEALIGHGGMSIVYRAEHLRLERTVALKLLAPELSDDESFRERFMRESRLAASLDHPNVIPIYEAGDENGVFYIAMRFVSGSNLKTLLQRNGPLGPDDTVSIIGQVASALNAAHEMKGLVHRDVKPANILVVDGHGDDPHHVYLSDFGIAKNRASNVLTRTGMFVGTADYASPEQIEGKELDRRADVYSLGCVLYESLTGAPAYEKDSEVALMYAHLLEPPPKVTAVRHDLPPEIDDVVARAMAKSRDERYGTTKELAAALRGALAPGAVAAATAREPAPNETVFAAAPSQPTAAVGIPAMASQPTAAGSAAAATPPVTPPAPPSEPAAAPPQAPVPPDGTGPGRGRKFPLIPAIIVGLLIVGAIIAAVILLTGGSSSSKKTTGGTVTAPKTLLEALVPTGISKDCSTDSTPTKGSVESNSCESAADAPTGYPDTYTIAFYPTAATRDTAYDAAKAKMTIGDCGATPGEKTWLHPDGKRAGRRVCGSLKSSGNSVVVWTHEKLGSPNHFETVGVAQSNLRGANIFRSWWNSVNDDIGKCRPKVSEDACFALIDKFEKKKPAS